MRILVTGGCGFIESNYIQHTIRFYPDDSIVNLDLLTYAGNVNTYTGSCAPRRSCINATRKSKIKLIHKMKGNTNHEIDTSPSLGLLNRTIISTCDGFIIPCKPDMFSLYGIRNIGRALSIWQREFATLKSILPNKIHHSLPDNFVRFLGYTIYNVAKRSGKNELDLVQAHYNYAKQIPKAILDHISPELPKELLVKQIGNGLVMHSHGTLPNMAQKYRTAIWRLPSLTKLEKEDASTIKMNTAQYEATLKPYTEFAKDIIGRIELEIGV